MGYTKASSTIRGEILVYLLHNLRCIANDERKLRESTFVPVSCTIYLVDVSQKLNHMFTLDGTVSRIPELVVHSCLEVSRPHLYPTAIVLALNHHTAADAKTGSIGDITVTSAEGVPILAVEVKHHMKITEAVVNTFTQKCTDSNMLRYIVTTDPIDTSYTTLSLETKTEISTLLA